MKTNINRRLKIKHVLQLVLGGVFVMACGFFSSPMGMSPRSPRSFPNANYASNGERIYFTATDDKGEHISYSGGQVYGGMMMGGYVACVSCHGVNGRGGRHSMHMQVMDAPAIYYDALVAMKQEDSGGADDYSLTDLRGVVVEGHDTNGKQLDPNMPRWQINDSDLTDLLAFLKTLP